MFELRGFHFVTFLSSYAHTTLELVACIMMTMRFCLDIAGVFANYDYLSRGAVAFCILLKSATLFMIGMNGATACLVVITLDRYWKIVHAIHHRKYYRRWMTYVGLFLPWLNGFVTHPLVAIATTKVVNGTCFPAAFRTTVCSVYLKRLIIYCSG